VMPTQNDALAGRESVVVRDVESYDAAVVHGDQECKNPRFRLVQLRQHHVAGRRGAVLRLPQLFASIGFSVVRSTMDMEPVVQNPTTPMSCR